MNVVEGRASVGVTELLEALTSLGRNRRRVRNYRISGLANGRDVSIPHGS